MLYKMKEGRGEEVQKYIQDLTNFQILLAGSNTPMFVYGGGYMINSGASLFATGAKTFMHPKSQLRWNECELGFTPHSGSSYYLSKLPGEIGTYLALTGTTMTGDDALFMKFADFEYDLPSQYLTNDMKVAGQRYEDTSRSTRHFYN